MGLPLVSGWEILTFAFPLESNFQAIPKSPVAREFPAFLAPHAPTPTRDSGVVIIESSPFRVGSGGRWFLGSGKN